ncbi:alpha/beta hydrolase [Nocardiopsis sp. NRRL B-16309]|uniref:alpha/beta hydrolase n=1 Tax=Nocardiopsis sp. NRRL B-16309 TaxID=1519494 RepID=UPI0006AEEEA5|nr:alpha/beta hydrolase [Nocardiopsis sp. NRRL B-16309]KOX11266.1 hypothetical protein ADL05_23830 [Nocardiopsis sp. NRRL B-16309]
MSAPVADRRTTGAWARWLPLVPLTAAVTVLAATGVLPTWPGLVHLVALPPLDLFGDLRVLLTTTTGPVSFGFLLAAVLAVRVVVLALMTGGLTRDRVVLAAVFYGILLPPTLLAAESVYIAGALLYSRLYWGALAAVAVLFVLGAAVPWSVRGDGRARLRDGAARAWRAGLRVEVLVPYGAAVVAIGALAHLFPQLAVALVPVSALATGAAATALSRPARPGGRRRLAAAAAVLVLVAWVWVGSRTEAEPEAAVPREGSIMLMSGIDSHSGMGDIFRSRTDLLGYDCASTYYFSYAGAGDGQPQGLARCPIRTGAPYTAADTERPMEELVAAFAEQTADLPRPLVVAGHSQGAWVAWEAVATGAAPRVDVLVLVGPFQESTGGYRPPGAPGPGRPASDLLHLLVPLSRAVDFTFAPRSPAGYELLGTTRAPARIMGTPLPEDTRSLSITSATDLPLMPSGRRLPVDRNACPLRAPHPYLATTGGYYVEVNRFLDGDPGLDCPAFRDWGVPLSTPFSAPPLLVEPEPGPPGR